MLLARIPVPAKLEMLSSLYETFKLAGYVKLGHSTALTGHSSALTRHSYSCNGNSIASFMK